jgi:ubiquinone/menaquinone biosynthesis C-methylase UbiE
MKRTSDEIDIQRRYYSATAHKYNHMHLQQGDEHFFALSFLVGIIDHFGFKSVLDVGSGTGRALLYIKERKPKILVKGIEPVEELRDVGHNSGLSKNELVAGDAMNVDFDDGAFDVVTEFGVLHHVRYPHLVVSEMLRVAKRAVFISDSNNFGHGNFTSRTIKQLLNFLGLWQVADLIKTGGRGYRISAGDGLSYSYSVFNNYKQVKNQCKSVHILNTTSGAINPYRSASHVALLGIKK